MSLVAVVDADRMGFLRSATSLVQTIGRAARHVDGLAVLYARGAVASRAMADAIAETDRRRALQLAHNAAHGLVPMAALVAGTFLSPAIPFRDEADLAEYQEMQDSYRSDEWQPPRKWERMGVPRPLDSDRPDGAAYPSQGPPGYRDP